MSNIILFPDGHWEHEVDVKTLENVAHARIVIDAEWADREISEMVTQYWACNVDWIFN
jgi:hypothetical protein